MSLGNQAWRELMADQLTAHTEQAKSQKIHPDDLKDAPLRARVSAKLQQASVSAKIRESKLSMKLQKSKLAQFFRKKKDVRHMRHSNSEKPPW